MRLAPVPATAPPSSTAEERVSEATRTHLRGSSILFAGRLISLAVNFATQVLIVRYLSKADFGAFAYGLSLVTMGQAVSVLGLDKAVSRFLPIYDEQRAHDRLLGTLVLVVGTVLALGVAFIAVAFGFHSLLGGRVDDAGGATTVLLILILLSPIQALDDVLMGTFAVFSRPRAIFFRKYVLAPGLRLLAIALVIALHSDVRALAVGYVLAGAAGVGVYAGVLFSTLRAEGLLARGAPHTLRFPAREIYAFALPLVLVDLLAVVMNTSNVVMLGHFGDAREVADYRVVQPAAHLNMLVMTSFTLLFTPLAARLFARGDRAGIQDLYWRTAVWLAVCSFPIFAATFALSHSITVALFGGRYAASAAILALLALGYYFSAALGFNGLTLRVFGLVRYTVAISAGAAAVNVAVNLLLIPRYGAVGAGVGTCATLVVYNLLKQAGLRRTGIRPFDRRHARVYAVLAGATAVLAVAQRGLDPGPAFSIALVAAASAAVVALTRRSLLVADIFPELLRVPLLRRVVT
jgi:O-antigen/teichoic acid export membrane protein